MHQASGHLYAIGDLHLPGPTGKAMDIFGPHWRDHARRIAEDWDGRVGEQDVVLIPGDISWAMSLEEAATDLAWLGARPGIKILIRGNHDYWWQAIGKVRRALPPGCVALQNDAWVHPTGQLAVAGTRLWDVPRLSQGDIFEAPSLQDAETPAAREVGVDDSQQRNERLFAREVARLEMSLSRLPPSATHKVVMTHYPPTNVGLDATAVTDLLERHGVELCLFGHLHGVRASLRFAGARQGVSYRLVSADYTQFRLAQVMQL